MRRVAIQLEAGEAPFAVIVEPWAAPSFEVRPGERAAIIVEHPSIEPTVTCGVIRGEMYVTVYDSGSTFQFVRDGVVEFAMPDDLAIPALSGRPPRRGITSQL
jgi:hypothetical protein